MAQRISGMDEEERREREKWIGILDRIDNERRRRKWRLQQEQRRADLGLGYLQRLPSLTALELVADAVGLELVIGLRDPHAPDLDKEFIVLGVCREEGRMTELELLFDRYANEYVPPRPWRAALEARGSEASPSRSFDFHPTVR